MCISIHLLCFEQVQSNSQENKNLYNKKFDEFYNQFHFTTFGYMVHNPSVIPTFSLVNSKLIGLVKQKL